MQSICTDSNVNIKMKFQTSASSKVFEITLNKINTEKSQYITQIIRNSKGTYHIQCVNITVHMIVEIGPILIDFLQQNCLPSKQVCKKYFAEIFAISIWLEIPILLNHITPFMKKLQTSERFILPIKKLQNIFF